MELEKQCSQQAECKPLSSLEELLKWDEHKITHQPAVLSKAPVALFDHDGKPLDGIDPPPRLLICHDMKGGYLEDRLHGGHDDPSSYTFYHWSLVDEFVYFSHNLVTIPPCCWVDTAHKHGVAIYGTLMTEFADGAEICRHLLRSEQTVDSAIDRLVAISRHYGLDGWLLNIENKVDAQQLPTLQYLVRRLTERMHEEIPESRVIWYDSVTRDGELRWQDQLNELNECFFRLCDGIFLNYCWTPGGLVSSRERAGPRSRDVYVGVDVFGRGCPGGGGFNAVQPVAESRWLGLSAALFAPGWTHERLGGARFPVAEDVLWSRLAPLLAVSGPARLPLTTSFCQGRGLRRYTDGQVTGESRWHQLSSQQRQPCHQQRSRPADLPLTDAEGRPRPAAFELRCPAARQLPAHGKLSEKPDGRTAEQRRIESVCAAGEELAWPGWQAHHTLEDGFCGGGCLTVGNQSDSSAVFRLFSCDLASEPGAGRSSLAVMYAVKPTGDTPADNCALCVDLTDPTGAGVSRYVLLSAKSAVDLSEPGLASGVGRVLSLRPVPAGQLQDSLPSESLPGPPQAGWITRFYRLQGTAAGAGQPPRVRSIGVYLPAGGSALLGYLAVHGCPDPGTAAR